MLRKLTKLYGEPGRVNHVPGANLISSAWWELPIKAVSFRKVQKGLNSTGLELLEAVAG
jgi:hypothetical protein